MKLEKRHLRAACKGRNYSTLSDIYLVPFVITLLIHSSGMGLYPTLGRELIEEGIVLVPYDFVILEICEAIENTIRASIKLTHPHKCIKNISLATEKYR